MDIALQMKQQIIIDEMMYYNQWSIGIHEILILNTVINVEYVSNSLGTIQFGTNNTKFINTLTAMTQFDHDSIYISGSKLDSHSIDQYIYKLCYVSGITKLSTLLLDNLKKINCNQIDFRKINAIDFYLLCVICSCLLIFGFRVNPYLLIVLSILLDIRLMLAIFCW